MKKTLSIQEYASVAIMLFGMFFGAGNLIFPVHLGQLAGSAMWRRLPGPADHRRGPAFTGRGGPGHLPQQRSL